MALWGIIWRDNNRDKKSSWKVVSENPGKWRWWPGPEGDLERGSVVDVLKRWLREEIDGTWPGEKGAKEMAEISVWVF